jgi:hypothetical protein
MAAKIWGGMQGLGRARVREERVLEGRRKGSNGSAKRKEEAPELPPSLHPFLHPFCEKGKEGGRKGGRKGKRERKGGEIREEECEEKDRRGGQKRWRELEEEEWTCLEKGREVESSEDHEQATLRQ